MSTLLYLRNFITDKQIASIMPTSHAGVKRVCGNIDFGKKNVIVEYGPAAGVFSQYLLERLSADSTLILVERNANFVSVLRRTMRDPRVSIFHDSAENIADIAAYCGIESADYVISGIPFSFFPESLRDRIVAQTYAVLAAGGKFLPYQTFFQRDKHLKHHMKAYFRDVRDEYFILNAPPMRIYEGVK